MKTKKVKNTAIKEITAKQTAAMAKPLVATEYTGKKGRTSLKVTDVAPSAMAKARAARGK